MDDAGALGGRDELAGRDVAALGMLPAQQRLDADEPLVVEGELRLVVQRELIVGIQRAAQVAEQGEARGRVDAVLGSKKTAPALRSLAEYMAMSALREQLVGRRAVVRRERHADAGLDVERRPARREAALQRVAQALGDVARRSPRCSHARQQDGELVAAEARHGVAVADTSRSRAPTWRSSSSP